MPGSQGSVKALGGGWDMGHDSGSKAPLTLQHDQRDLSCNGSSNRRIKVNRKCRYFNNADPDCKLRCFVLCLAK